VGASLNHVRNSRLVACSAAFASVATLVACAALASTPAHALISGEFGVDFRAATEETVPGENAAALKYHGGPVIPASDTYAIYWDPVNAYHNDWMTLIDRYLHDVGAASGQLSNIFSLNGQYTGPGGTRASYKSTFRGAYSDTTPYPASGGCKEPAGQPTCLTDAQIRSELKRFIEANHLPTGLDVIYFVLTPPAVTVCTDEGKKGNCSDSATEKEEEETDVTGSVEKANGFCGYHSAIEPSSASPIVYGVQPWVAGHAGHILVPVPVKTELPSGAALACQNRKVLVEPNQNSTVSHFDGYEAGLADIIINGLSIEQDDIVVDPLLNGWYQDVHPAHYEQSDLCKGGFSPASSEELPKPPETTHALNFVNESVNGSSYYFQWGLSSVGITSGKGIGCWEGTELLPHFTATNPVNGSDIVAFDANESGMTLDANVTELKLDEPYLAPVYKWDFGDGMPVVNSGLAASVFHSYAYGGNYPVTLTVTDSGGNTASITNTIPVLGSPAPGSGTNTAGPGASAGPGAGSQYGSTPQNVPGPVVTDFVESKSLKKALSNGLAVRYTVNEQVAGSIQLLLDGATAKRLGIRGSTATGLPKGTPRSIVVGTAVLVTTKAGQGTIRIKFSSRTAARLAHTRKLKLTLRLFARNASRQSPQTTTMLSTVTLNR
jgi:PKD repeat protein